MNTDLINKLADLGLSKYESRAYVSLLSEHPARPYQISKSAGVPASKIYEVMGRLEARGLVVQMKGQHEGYAPKDPEKALAEWRADYLGRLGDVEQRLKSITAGKPTYMIWNTLQNDDVLDQGRRLLSAAHECVFLSATAQLMEQWLAALGGAKARGTSMHLISYGAIGPEMQQLGVRELGPPSPVRTRGSVLAVDHASVLFVSAAAPGTPLQASWTDNPAIALMAEEYVEDKLFIEQAIEDGWLRWGDVE